MGSQEIPTVNYTQNSEDGTAYIAILHSGKETDRLIKPPVRDN